MWKMAGIVAGLGFSVSPALANPFSGERDVMLHSGEGSPIKVAQIAFQPSGDAAQYKITWDDSVFSDHFLSMRPFKCLEGAEKLWCRVPYPYAIARVASDEDLTDLEYDLMFVWKNEGEYGIDLWNGVYYDIAPSGDILVGTMHDFDMNVIASPPEDGNLRPIESGDLEEADADSHWLPKLTIE
jgi:hypothetical protein